MTSDRKKLANQRNATKSTGPKTKIGKKNASANALMHGLYSRELKISDAEKAEFESLRDDLLAQLNPGTALQTVAFEQIVCSSWRCKLALRLETNRLTANLTTSKEAASDESGGQRDERVFQWFGASHQDLIQGISFLKALRADVDRNGGLHLDDWKERIVKGFGVGFYDDLKDWAPMHIDAILMAEHLVRHANTFRTKPSAAREPSTSAAQQPNASAAQQISESVEMIADPRQKLQMLVKLVDVQIQHLVNLRQVYAQLQEREQVHTDFVPRYFTTASRDQQKAVDWFLYLQSQGL